MAGPVPIPGRGCPPAARRPGIGQHDERHRSLFGHRMRAAMRMDAVSAALTQILSVIGGIEDCRAVQRIARQQPFEEAADLPEERVAVSVAIAPPLLAVAAEPVAAPGVGNAEEPAARQRRAVHGMAVGIFVVHREMRTDLVDQDEFAPAIGEMAHDPAGGGMVPRLDRNVVELDEGVDPRPLRRIHAIVQSAAGALRVDIDRREPGPARIVPDRRPARIDLHIAVARTAVAQRQIGAERAIGDRRRDAEIMHRDAWRRRQQAGADPAGIGKVEIARGNAFIDHQHDIAVAGRFSRLHRDGPTRTAIRQSLARRERQIGKRRERSGQAARAIAAAQKQ